MTYTSTRLLLGVLAVACAVPSPLTAQDKPAELPIAVLNLDKVFAGYTKHSDRLQPLRDSAKELDETVQIRQVELETAANQMRKSPPGSPDQQRAQGQLIKLQNDLRQFVEQERQKLQKREVVILITTQRDIDEQLKKICQARGLKLVLRQNSPPDENQPLQELVKNLGRDVIYQDGLDITDDVLKALNETESK
ncbi:Outer membrane protein (OmpH-like) [Anatilimnocola aggregata]|uniref:Outer membrane protein (OmpH-like) n=1 Tax=Anatilimnocola aggregata TaxID=2528021 RepID=A0A517YMJ1_9BACT|nr:OmpH family outer membrane protein [Anatilimnocola aggregata]QDU31434.1 Outer membrane protein (OmpH-like) [Anatilimnocola aggregata]